MIHRSCGLLSTKICCVKLCYFIHKLPPLVVNLNLHTSMLIYVSRNLVPLVQFKKHPCRPSSLIGFASDHLLKYSIKSTKCLKPPTSVVLPQFWWQCFEVHLYFLNFSLLLTLVIFLNKFFDIAFDIVPEKSIWNLLFCWIPSTMRSHCYIAFGSCPNPLWTLLIIVCCRSIEKQPALYCYTLIVHET